MALKNKDGTPYRLQGPNPVMKAQTLWDNFVVHNMEWACEYAEDTTVVKPMRSDFQVREDFLAELDKAKVIESSPEPTPVERRPVVKPDPAREEQKKRG